MGCWQDGRLIFRGAWRGSCMRRRVRRWKGSCGRDEQIAGEGARATFRRDVACCNVSLTIIRDARGRDVTSYVSTNKEGGFRRPRLALIRETTYIILTLATCMASLDMVPVTVT